LTLVSIGCGKSNPSQAKAAPALRATPVGVSEVRQRDVPIVLEGLGTVTAYNTVTIRSRVDGEIVKVNFREGQEVRAGDLLAIIDPRPFDVALQQAQATLARDQGQYDTARINAQRDETLAKEGIVAQQQADQSRALYEQFQGAVQMDNASIENAKLNLVYTRITAPVSGRIGLRLIDAGNIVHANDQNGMLVITQMEPIAVVFTLPEDNLPVVVGRMKTGVLPVDAFSRDDRTKIASGKLETIDNQIDTTTGTVRLKTVFDNKDRALWPNQFVNVHLQLETRKNAIVAPASAVQRGPQNSTFAYVVGGDSTVQVRTIQVELTQGHTALIASGLQPGDRVVTDGQEKLQAGMKVEPQAAQRNAAQEDSVGKPPQGTPPRADNAAQTPAASRSQGGTRGDGSGPASAGTRR
jgi:multidrug efflux system membrane fusion protein